MKKESLLSQWKKLKEKEPLVQKITKSSENTNLPLSKGQERLWFLQQLYPGNPFYNYAEHYTFTGILHLENLQASLKLVLEEHEILKACFSCTEGKVTQTINKNIEVPIFYFDISSLGDENKEQKKNEILEREAKMSFDLAVPPLIRITVVKEDTEKYNLFIVLHHIIVDKWSMGIFKERLSQHYRAFQLHGESEARIQEIQYSDYACWQRKTEVPKDEIEYWKNKLSGDIPSLDLPFDHEKPLHPSFKGAILSRKFPNELSEKLLSTAKKLEVTPYVLLLSVFYSLLYKYSGQEDILVGTPVSNRDQKILEGLIGFFNDTVVLRARLSEDLSFKTFVEQVRAITLDAFQNKNVPFEVLVKELRPNRSFSDNPFFQVMFLYHTETPLPYFGPDVSMGQSLFDPGVSKFDLTLYFAQNEEGLSATFEYSTELFSDTTINRMHEHLSLLLNAIVANPEVNISKIPMLSGEDRKVIFKSTSTQKIPLGNFKGIHEIIIDTAAHNMGAIAVVAGSNSLSYKELLEESEKLAQQILSYTQGRKQIIALALHRTKGLVVGILGILRSGCAYLPIDPDYPAERMGFMIDDAKVSLIITQNSLLSNFKPFNIDLIIVDSPDIPPKGKLYIPPKTDLADMAYLIYTSGSTGKPKGVPISHGNLINSTLGRLDFYKENPESFLLLSSISFDSSKAGLFWTLCTGGTIVLSEKHLEQDIEKISDTIVKYKVSHTLMLPSLYKLLLEHASEEKLRGLKTVIVAGENCTSRVVEAHFGKMSATALYNEYGPTEATVWCIAHKIEPKDANGKIPIGKPVAGAKIFLLDQNLNLVPWGAVGTIYVGGPGLSEGYWQRPDLSAHVFVENPLIEDPGEKMYNTGDLGRYRGDGAILFMGRKDQQVKIRGYRIELSEIENLLLKFPKVKDAVVLTGNRQKDKILNPILNCDPEGIIQFLLTSLNDQQADELLSAIENLNSVQKDYLLEQLEN